MENNSIVKKIAYAAKEAKAHMNRMNTKQKNDILESLAKSLIDRTDEILAANRLDIAAAEQKGRTKSLIDRLTLTENRIAGMANGLREIAALPDPIGEVLGASRRPNGLRIEKRRVPIGVIGIIYEARPNVTSDAAGLCLKTSNTVVLRGGSEAIHSNTAVVDALTQAGLANGMPAGAIGLVTDTSRDSAQEMMTMNGTIDVLIPRGGSGLIQSVVRNSTIPVIETGAGNCHIYADKTADLEMACNITINAKTSRPAVCNAAETLLVHRAIAEQFLPMVFAALKERGVEVRGCPECSPYGAVPANDEDYDTEYSDLILAVKVVEDIDEAIDHINRHSTHHSEAIITNDYHNAQKFKDEIDSAAVYVNASTRFTDGYEFGFGAEIGISTQKLHARGPMGLTELTTTKYVIDGNGQIRC